MIVVIIVFNFVDFSPPSINIKFDLSAIHHENVEFTFNSTSNETSYNYPWWGDMMAVMLNFVSLLVMVVYALFYVVKHGLEPTI